jgi:superfamily II DNA or RNA helicase
MRAILSEAGFAFNATEYISLYGNEALLKLMRKYTVRTVDRVTKIPKTTKLFTLIKANGFKVIELPRFASRQLVSGQLSAMSPIADIDIQLPAPKQIDTIEYIGQSNPNQLVVVNHIVSDMIATPTYRGFTMKLLAGQGKTYAAMDIIGRMKLKTLVVVPNTYLLDQWVVLLREYFPTAKIGTLYGKHKEDGDIIVAIVNTMAELHSFEEKEKKPWPNVGKTLRYVKTVKTILVDALMKDVGLTIMDESQMYCSKEFRKVFKRIHSRYTLGLSATPDIREDKLDIIHQLWLGPILDAETLPGFNVTQDAFISTANMIEYHALDEHCKFNIRDDTGMIDYASIVESIVTDPHRNNLIIDKIIQLMDKGLYTFVFSDRRSHLEYLYELLEARCIEMHRTVDIELPESSRKVILYGGSTEETIDKAKRLGTVIFTTYAYAAVGVSITKLNALVLATPRRSNMKQIINRVFRLGSDQTIRRIIVDVCDAKLPIKGQKSERIKAYRERGCDITKQRVYASPEIGIKIDEPTS